MGWIVFLIIVAVIVVYFIAVYNGRQTSHKRRPGSPSRSGARGEPC